MAPVDPVSLQNVFTAHAATLVLYARQWLPPDQAEDVVQEAFIAMLQLRSAPPNIKAWLFARVRHGAIDALRSTRRRQQREQRFASQHPMLIGEPDALIDARHAAEALQLLPAFQRELIVLRIWGQMTFAQIAELVHAPLSTIHDQYRAGLSELRLKLESPCPKN